MGHRKHSQPRRGSIAYLPRGRAQSMEARIRSWSAQELAEPKLLGHLGFKAGCVQIVSVDDRDKTPNFGKQLVSLGTVIVTPPVTIVGIRGYEKTTQGKQVGFDYFAKDLPKKIKRSFVSKIDPEIDKKKLGKISDIFALVVVIPRDAKLEQKKPFIFEVAVRGGDIPKQFEYIKNLLGKEVKIDQVFQTGQTIDVAAITKGKGWEGPITRWGVKRKQHKSRKSVREVASLGPISPSNVMFTVPRAGQRGFHQRTEYNKRIMIMDNTDNSKFKINPGGGFKHFGIVDGDFIVVRGSVPGTYRRLIKFRTAIRKFEYKIKQPNILEVVV